VARRQQRILLVRVEKGIKLIDWYRSILHERNYVSGYVSRVC